MSATSSSSRSATDFVVVPVSFSCTGGVVVTMTGSLKESTIGCVWVNGCEGSGGC